MPRISTILAPPEAPRGDFVGRVGELRQFRASVDYVLGHAQPPAANPIFPHIFLISGEGGMGKSSLLRQFQHAATEAGLPPERVLLLDLANHSYPTAEAFAQALAATISAEASTHYHAALERRRALRPRFEELQRQWQRWSSVRPDSNDRQALLDALQGRKRHLERQTATFGINTPPHITLDLADADRQLDEVQSFFDQHGHAPQSFEELLARRLGDDATLFQDDHAALGKALEQDVYALAEHAPLLLLIDTYEQADRYDGWLRRNLLAEMSDQLMVVIAGRAALDDAYRKQFDSALPGFVVAYDLDTRRLSEAEVGGYLALRLKQSVPPDALVAEAFRICKGIPLATRAIGDQLANGGTLAPFADLATGNFDESEIVRGVVQRFLSNVHDHKDDAEPVRERKRQQRQQIRALALLRPGHTPDEQLIGCLLNLPPAASLAALTALADRHSFVFQKRLFQLHDLVHEFVRADLREEQRRSADWSLLEAGLRSGLALAGERRAQRERATPDADERSADGEWREAILDQCNALLWLGEDDEAMRLLLNRWLEAQHANTTFADELRDLATRLKPRGPVWQRLLALLAGATPDYAGFSTLTNLLEPHSQTILLMLQADANESAQSNMRPNVP